jgi:hypothetical protein
MEGGRGTVTVTLGIKAVRAHGRLEEPIKARAHHKDGERPNGTYPGVIAQGRCGHLVCQHSDDPRRTVRRTDVESGTAMIVEIVFIDLPAGTKRADALALYRQSAGRWLANPELIEKYYFFDEERHLGGGVYIWPTREAALRGHGREYVERVQSVYGAPPRIQILDRAPGRAPPRWCGALRQLCATSVGHREVRSAHRTGDVPHHPSVERVCKGPGPLPTPKPLADARGV